MKRREFLASGALIAGSTALSGCVDHVLEQAESQPPIFDDHYDEEERTLPVERRFDRVIEAIHRAEDAAIADYDAFRTFLEDAELSVDSLEAVSDGGETILELEYTDDGVAQRGVLRGLGVVSGGYAILVSNGESATKLEATIHEPGGQPFGEFDVETGWAEEFLEGVLSASEYAGEVMQTLETTA